MLARNIVSISDFQTFAGSDFQLRPDLSHHSPIFLAVVITIASFKGGVGKSTTAIHLAAYLQKKAPTVLIDGDPNRSVCAWALAGQLPFQVIHIYQAARLSRNYEHAVIDTSARLEPK